VPAVSHRTTWRTRSIAFALGGVDAASGVESAPGIKDPTLVRRFVSTAKAAEPEDYRGREDRRPFDWMLDE
jgi:hypothetical protein